MKVKDFLKLDTWVLVEKEWLNPTNGELRNTGKVLGPFASGGDFEEEGFPGYARYFWLHEKLER